MSREGDEKKDAPGNYAESETANQEGGSDQQLPPAITSPNPPPPPPGGSTTNQNSHEWRENTKLVLEVIGVLLLLAYTWFTCLQWLQIRYTNNLTARALDGNGYVLDATLAKMQSQIDVMNRQADAAGKQADAANSAAVTASQTMKTGQRSWIYIGKIQPWPQDNEPSDSTKIRIAWNNSGKSVAHDVLMVVFADSCENDLPASDYVYSKKAMREYGDISPSDGLYDVIRMHHDCKTGKSVLLPLTFDYGNLVKENKVVIVHGQLNYADIFGQHHWIRFCRVSQPQIGEFPTCNDAPGQGGNGHNKTDQDK